MLVTVIALDACTERKLEKHIDIPAPIAIAQWADRVDTLAGTYTYAGAPIQFGDSVVVLADAQDNTVWKVDLAATSRAQIGTKGDGPGEYRSPGTLAKIHGDSVALLRGTPSSPIPVISVVNGRGRTHTIPQLSATVQVSALLRNNAPMLRYTDSIGNVYGQTVMSMKVDKNTGGPDLSSMGSPDTIPIVRYNLHSGRTDTLVRLPAGVLHGRREIDANGGTISLMSLGPYGAFNNWCVTQDGRVITADAATYTMQVRDTAGAIVNTWQISSNAVPVSTAGWNEYVQKTTKGSIVEIKKLTDKVFAGMGVAPPKLRARRYIVPAMPRELPRLNFDEGVRRMHVNGNVLWIPVHIVDPPRGNNWDLIDMTSRTRIQTLTLPNKQFLMQVTNLGAYVVAIDDDDLERVLLYRHKQ